MKKRKCTRCEQKLAKEELVKDRGGLYCPSCCRKIEQTNQKMIIITISIVTLILLFWLLLFWSIFKKDRQKMLSELIKDY